MIDWPLRIPVRHFASTRGHPTRVRRADYPLGAAATMVSATTRGCDTSATCEADVSVVWAPIRPAMNRCEAGGMIVSPAETRYQLGTLDHEGGPEDSRLAHNAIERWCAS